MRLHLAAFSLLGLFAVACGSSGPAPTTPPSAPPAAAAEPTAEAKPDPYKTDLENWCNAPSRAPGASTAAPDARPRLIAEWISAQLQTKRAKDLAASLGAMEPGKRGGALRKEAEEQGVMTCPFADEVDAKK